MIKIETTSQGLSFKVAVLPRSSKIAILGSHGEALKIKLTAPPVGSAANKQCIQVLSKALAVPKSAMVIASGHTHRLKQIRILTEELQADGVDIQALKEKVALLGDKSKQTP